MMRAPILSQKEGAPESVYPAAPFILSEDAAAVDPSFVWQRIEMWCAYRWIARPVTWVSEGPGEFIPPLAPATIETVEIWRGDRWEATEVREGPLGYLLTCPTQYRLTGTAGGGETPAAVWEAFRRLAEYFAGTRATGSGDPSIVTESDGDYSYRRAHAHMGKALILSGAADLLRPYRRT